MSVYPIKSRSVSLDHRGGTKSYHLMLIEAANGHCIVVNRWGKTGQFGEVKIEQFDSPVKAQKAWDKKEREKTGKGYSQVGSTSEKRAEDQSSLTRTIGLSMFNKLGASNVKWLDPSFDTVGMREVDDPQYDEETGAKLDNSRKADLTDLMAEQERAERERAANAYNDNDLYGRF